jgi:hypothetical protein
MKTNPSSNVRNRKLEAQEADEYGFPANGDWSALEAQAQQEMSKNKDSIEKGRAGGSNHLIRSWDSVDSSTPNLYPTGKKSRN